MSLIKCKISRNRFCYICGNYIVSKKETRSLTTTVKIAYRCYFNNIFEIECEPWAPSASCGNCYTILLEQSRGLTIRKLPFHEPAIWRQPSNHPEDCYFCSVNILGFNKTNQKSIHYPNIPSVKRPTVFHEEAPPVPRSTCATLIKPASFDVPSSYLDDSYASFQPLSPQLHPRPLLILAAFPVTPFFHSSVPEYQSYKRDYHVSNFLW